MVEVQKIYIKINIKKKNTIKITITRLIRKGNILLFLYKKSKRQRCSFIFTVNKVNYPLIMIQMLPQKHFI
ncbi:hypothetical protein Hanom_Chr05g00427291 [Helianthus anomalus]